MADVQANSGSLEGAIAALATTPRLLVALDFDGTLAPLVDRPEEARALPAAREAMLALTRAPDTRVALISGRAMQSLMHVAEPPEAVWLSGSHGVEVRLDAAPGVSLSEAEQGDLSRLREILEAAAAPFDDIWIEVKPAGFALHSRSATPQDAEEAERQAHERVSTELPAITERRGSNVLEFSVRSTTKGDAVRMLREAAGATAVLFAGDDVTDEDGFAVLGDADVGIKCGPGATAAKFRVEDPAAVARVLSRLAELRAH
ncbi:trehalose-phosphatase [Homoserinimonas hongtaonis]|uniref:Trehalose 6-phosphate phosphatase n=1 Tax=Homoserinimonas hongtaonis TaxID=2079791 RepID=A0A2U1SWV1_9MICO|nr:trehalose-phosphatase [Salinibacterium hongtaonis]AWB88697.1 trehalose-phosphatase [Salinibacterium hongtaonis]PWB96107.1 trehalose-phosphatase [Salinibacterium hongtaonis]